MLAIISVNAAIMVGLPESRIQPDSDVRTVEDET